MRKRTPELSAAAQRLVDRLDELGRVSDETGALTRTFLSPAMERANVVVGSWMRQAGLTVREDETGNLIGRREASGPARRRKPKTLLLGSHLDTVRNAGRFDGALGVLLPIVAMEELQRQGIELPFAVEVLGFSEEEAVRFLGAYIGSKAYTGRLRPADLKLKDARGLTLQEVIESHSGRKFSLPKSEHAARDLIGYLEVHLEQGPVLEAEGLGLGVVSAIASQTRGRLTFGGKAGHAGTTPMALRRDALGGAAEFVLAVEAFAQKRAPLVATVGTLVVPSSAANVIPGQTILSLDVRHPFDTKCQQAVEQLVKSAQAVARRRKLDFNWEKTMQHPATSCVNPLTDLLAESAATVQSRVPTLVSGAGHDGVVMSELTPVTMLFVRCRDGLSHHPDEHVSPADLDLALRATIEFLQRLARREAR
ncbi:MAG: allantoate amidohydrolase [Opitutus sp.]